jgi:flagellar motor switch protein FliM
MSEKSFEEIEHKIDIAKANIMGCVYVESSPRARTYLMEFKKLIEAKTRKGIEEKVLTSNILIEKRIFNHKTRLDEILSIVKGDK